MSTTHNLSYFLLSPTWFVRGVESRVVPFAGMQVLPFAPEVVQSLGGGGPDGGVLAEGDEGRVGVVGVGNIGENISSALKVQTRVIRLSCQT